LGFSVTSTVFAGVMIICYSLTLAFYYRYANSPYRLANHAPYVMSILILILSVIEFGVGIWASVCCCIAFSGQQVQTVSKRMKLIFSLKNVQVAILIFQCHQFSKCTVLYPR
jgi:hypothetical protein